MDEQLAEFINSLYQRNRPLYIAGDALSGLKRFYPRLRRHLDLSGMYYKTWVKLIKRRKAIPLTKDIVRGMAVAGLLYGTPDFAAAILIGFASLLRTGEICSIQMKDVRIVHDDMMSVSLSNSKGAVRSGTSESVIIRDPALVQIIRPLKSKFGDEKSLYDGDCPAFRAMYKKAAVFYGLHSERATPHGIRRGGATWHFLFLNSYDLTQALGRWQQARTAKSYIDEAVAEITQASLPEYGQNRLRRANKALSRLLRNNFPTPPSRQALFGSGCCKAML